MFFGLILTSCNYISKDVEISFNTMNVKLDSLSKEESDKVEKLIDKIKLKEISKSEIKNSTLIYSEVIKYNKIIDSLISISKSDITNLVKIEIKNKFNKTKYDLNVKFNSMIEFKTKRQIDSLLKESKDIDVLPNFAITTELLNGKINGIKSAKLLLEKI